MPRQQGFEARAPLRERQRAQVPPVLLEQVVGQNAPGRSRRVFRVGFCRPMRRCSRANGSGASPSQASISPSSTVPSGSAAAAATTSGNRAVITSSPRDQM